MNANRIIDNKIVMQGFAVVLNVQPSWDRSFINEYLVEMASEFKGTETKREAAAILRSLNNDGSWGIKAR